MTASNEPTPATQPAAPAAVPSADEAGHRPTPPGELRLTLSPSFGRGALDGAWWPRSDDLSGEVANLVDHFPAESGRVIRAAYSTEGWAPAPRRVEVAGGHIKIGAFPGKDTHRVLLSLSDGRILHILVVPPATGETSAAKSMTTAAEPENLLRAGAILQADAS